MYHDDFAQRLAHEYELFLFALSGQYLALVAPGVEASPASISHLERRGEMLRQTFLHTAARSVEDVVAAMGMDSEQAGTQDFLEELVGFTGQNVESLVARMKGVKNTTLDAMQDMHGAMGQLLQQKLSAPEFKLVTASGRSFEATGLVRSQARDFAYQNSIRASLSKFAQYTDLATVVYPDPSHKGHGLVFSITGKTAGYPTFDEIAAKVFHYNATAGVADHVPA
jgi:hypothetical protein